MKCLPLQAESVTLASISYQSLFRLFDKLSGMTGTAATESKEFKVAADLPHEVTSQLQESGPLKADSLELPRGAALEPG
eukprot:1982444-Amphidinium_carterae.1